MAQFSPLIVKPEMSQKLTYELHINALEFGDGLRTFLLFIVSVPYLLAISFTLGDAPAEASFPCIVAV